MLSEKRNKKHGKNASKEHRIERIKKPSKNIERSQAKSIAKII